MEVTPPPEEVDRTFACFIVRWSTSDEQLDYSVTKDVPKEDVVDVGEWYKIELLESLLDPAHLVTANRAVHH